VDRVATRYSLRTDEPVLAARRL